MWDQSWWQRNHQLSHPASPHPGLSVCLSQVTQAGFDLAAIMLQPTKCWRDAWGLSPSDCGQPRTFAFSLCPGLPHQVSIFFFFLSDRIPGFASH